MTSSALGAHAAVHAVLAQAEGSFWLPPQASNFAGDIDAVFYFILILDVIFFVALMWAMARFAWRYRRRSADQRTSPISHSNKLEFLWSAVPAVLLLIMFVYGQGTYMSMASPPADGIDVRVTGQKWQWTIDYPVEGKSCTDKLVVPVNEPVKLTMSSIDVIHSFFIPAFRLKQDVVPNRYTGYWFSATEPGTYDLFCAEYCGTEHSQMIGKVEVKTAEEWKAWLASPDCSVMDASSPDFGLKIFEKYCKACHTTDGNRLVGPSMKDLYGKMEPIAGGPAVQVDDNYLRESIVNPNAKVVEGYPPAMPAFGGQLDDAQINALIDYIKSLGAAQ